MTLIVRGSSLTKSMSHCLIEQLATRKNVHVRLGSEVTALCGSDHLEALDVTLTAAGETAWLPVAIERHERGYIVTGADAVRNGHWTLQRDPYLLETSVPGIFACGDVRYRSIKRVAAAVGEGSVAIAFVHQFLQAVRTPNN